jgi:predicted CXXCH cytochrome family protein
MSSDKTTGLRPHVASFVGVESMIRRTLVAVSMVLALLFCVPMAGCGGGGSDSVDYPDSKKPKVSDELTYAGSGACRTCHQGIYESWEKSRHTKKVRAASAATIVNDADSSGANDFVQGGAGATFDVATSVPAVQTTWDDYTLGAGVEFPKLGFDGTDRVIRIGPVTYPVTYVLGGTGKWKQRYMVTIGNGEYISPVQYNDVTREYVPYHPEHWYTMSGTTLTGYLYAAGDTPVSEGNARNSWQRRCVFCHTTGLRDISVNKHGEYGGAIADMLDDGDLSELPVSCEACHGPGARHIELGGGVGTIGNPNDMASDRGDEVCGACHGRGTSVNAAGLGYPWAAGDLKDNGFRPGDTLADFYVNTGASSFWGDGAMHSKQHHQQWLDHRNSPHAKAGVTCWTCHAPHGSGIEGDLKMSPTELCLSCHDGEGNIDANDLSLHTRHDTAGAQSCDNCHYNLTAKSGIKYDVNSHTSRVIFPVETDGSGIPNSCAECHRDDTTAELTGRLLSRFPDVKPVAFAAAEIAGLGGFTLDGSASFDPLGGMLKYEWTYKAGPPSFTADQLMSRKSEMAYFVPSQPGPHTFLLVVTNADGVRSRAAAVTVDVEAGITQTPPDLTQADYMGAATCKTCHGEKHNGWQTSRHPQKTRRPDAGYGMAFADTDRDGVNDWLQGGFSVASGPKAEFTVWKTIDYDGGSTAAPILDYVAATNTYTVTIGLVTYDVHWVLGGTGKWKQRYMTTIGEGDYILPIQFNDVTNEWVSYHPENWYTIVGSTYTAYLYGVSDTPVSVGRTADSWQRRCTTCHATGARDMTQNPVTFEFGKSIETMLAATTGPRLSDTGIACEACHGPGSFHVNDPSLRGSIVNPSKLSALRSNEVCGACHNRGDSVHSSPATFGFPWSAPEVDGHFIPGMDLTDFYKPVDEVGSKFWSDPFGHAKSHHQQWLEMRWTSHFVKAGMTCATCHVTHDDNIPGQLKTGEQELCVSCHRDIVTGKGDDMNHSRHANGSTKCSSCHMPLTAKSAINYDISAHSWEIIWPQTTKATGIPNSCMSRGCHGEDAGGPEWDPTDFDDLDEALAEINKKWGDMRPYAEPRVVNADDKARRTGTFTGATTIKLDGTKSYDPNGAPIVTYSWTILSAPAGSTASFPTRLVAKPTIDVTVAGTYVFSLVVRDAKQSSEPRTVTVVVN